MSNSFILDFIRQKMLEAGIFHYDLSAELVVVDPNSTLEIKSENDVRFLANIFTSGSQLISGRITADNDATELTPALIATDFYKNTLNYKGHIKIDNMVGENLSIEFIVATPLKGKK